MSGKSYGKRFIYIWSAFFINWGVKIAVNIAASFFFTAVHMMRNYDEVMSLYGDRQATLQEAALISEYTSRYTTQLEGIAALIVIPIIFSMYRKDRMKENEKKRAPLIKYGLVVLLAGTLSIALNNLILIGNLSQMSTQYQDTAQSLYSAPLIMQIICLGILVPISEELVFRGMIFRRMREDSGFISAVIYSAVIFGMFHINSIQMIYASIMGLMLAYVCEKCHGVAAPILGHITANLVAVAATALGVFEIVTTNIWVGGVLTVGCAVIAAYVFLLIKEKP